MIGLEREGGNDTKYAAITLADSAVVNFELLPYTEAADKIMMIPYPPSSTNAQAGLLGWEHLPFYDSVPKGKYIILTVACVKDQITVSYGKVKVK